MIKKASTTFKPKDYTGQTIGISVALKRLNKKAKDGSHFWKLKCACGKIFERSSSRFRHKWSVYSCGCKQRPNAGRKQPTDLMGYKNMMATAIGPTSKRQKDSGYVMWKLRCDCGKEFERSARMLILGYTKSCGCRNFSMPKGRPRIPNGGAFENHFYKTYEKGAKVRDLVFEISKPHFLETIKQDCHYCGLKAPKRTIKNLSGHYFANGIDRKDSDKGYTEDNIVPCCTGCNFIKSRMLKQEFLEKIQRIFVHNAVVAANIS